MKTSFLTAAAAAAMLAATPALASPTGQRRPYPAATAPAHRPCPSTRHRPNSTQSMSTKRMIPRITAGMSAAWITAGWISRATIAAPLTATNGTGR